MTYKLYDHMDQEIIFNEECVQLGYILSDSPRAFNLTHNQEEELEKLIEENEEDGVYDTVLSYLDDNNIEHEEIGTYIPCKETYCITVEENKEARKDYSHCLYNGQLESCDFSYEEETSFYQYWDGSTNVLYLDDLSEDITLEITNLDEELDLPSFNTGYYRVFKGTYKNDIITYYLVAYSAYQGSLPYVDYIANSPEEIKEYLEKEEDC